MSYAASKLELESPRHSEVEISEESNEAIPEDEKDAVEKLLATSPPTSAGPVVAVDLDDVLSETNHAVAEWHNEVYGTNMDMSHFYYYYYWKNPFWGTVAETFQKVQDFYASHRIYKAKPVPGSREGIQTLRDMGFRLIIVTARSPDVAEHSWEWVNNHFPNLFDSVVCTGQFKDADKTGHEVTTKLSKSQVCADLRAQFLIDDSAENTLQCATADPPIPVLLFGNYEWNKRISGPGDARDEMSFDRRFEACGQKKFWEDESVEVPAGAPIWRVKDWGAVVRWVRSAIEEGRVAKPLG
ncbi:hypothetical protein BDN72DRAFT_754560 [Pluteus cervinus]|uniref:Uncharacterized protein n=1 Tax=Pluteus cervinus TaxID=181527 RepID=A0ACD3BGJ3_9AGAR|nr:hypothetical protein BDN72DRAFT_754560 [Pluteus cervinus]